MALVLPQVSAAIAMSGIADIRVVVICTSDGLRLVTLDANGQPVETAQVVERCMLIHAMDTAGDRLWGAFVPNDYATNGFGFRPEPSFAMRDGFSPAQPRAPPSA